MMKPLLVFLGLLLAVAQPVHALDSYRYLRVTIDTPWMIFLGLAMAVLLPFIVLMALYWYFAMKKKSAEGSTENEG